MAEVFNKQIWTVYMAPITEVYDKCLSESHQVPAQASRSLILSEEIKACPNKSIKDKEISSYWYFVAQN